MIIWVQRSGSIEIADDSEFHEVTFCFLALTVVACVACLVSQKASHKRIVKKITKMNEKINQYKGLMDMCDAGFIIY